MAGPSPSVSASTSASVAPKEMAFPLPPQSLQSVEKKLAAHAPPTSDKPAVPTEQVLAPARGTLAAGKYEARPATIWFVVAAGSILVLLWALLRVRKARLEAKRKLEALTTLKKPAT